MYEIFFLSLDDKNKFWFYGFIPDTNPVRQSLQLFGLTQTTWENSGSRSVLWATPKKSRAKNVSKSIPWSSPTVPTTSSWDQMSKATSRLSSFYLRVWPANIACSDGTGKQPTTGDSAKMGQDEWDVDSRKTGELAPISQLSKKIFENDRLVYSFFFL